MFIMFKSRHIVGTIIGVTLAVWFAIFLGWLLYYLWQFKFGTPEELTKTKSEFTKAQFSSANSSEETPKAPVDWKPYIKPTSPLFGNTKSPITLTAFIDFECPFSQEDYRTFKSVLDTYGPAVRVVYKHLPLTSIHPQALPAATAAACAQEQGKFWPFYHYLFTTNRFSDDDLTATAVALQLDMKQFVDCQKSERIRQIIETDVNDAIALGVRGTPTYFVNQDVLEGVTNRSVWDSVMVKNLKK